MASRKPILTVILAQEAENELDAILRYNIKKRGLTQALRYLTFLRTKIAGLAVEYDGGNAVEGRPDLCYLLMKQRSGSARDGHIAVYSIYDTYSTVEILHIFHTKQDW